MKHRGISSWQNPIRKHRQGKSGCGRTDLSQTKVDFLTWARHFSIPIKKKSFKLLLTGWIFTERDGESGSNKGFFAFVFFTCLCVCKDAEIPICDIHQKLHFFWRKLITGRIKHPSMIPFLSEAHWGGKKNHMLPVEGAVLVLCWTKHSTKWNKLLRACVCVCVTAVFEARESVIVLTDSACQCWLLVLGTCRPKWAQHGSPLKQKLHVYLLNISKKLE